MGKVAPTPASLATNLPLSQGDPPREFGVGDLQFAWLSRAWRCVTSVIGCHCRRDIPVHDLTRDTLKCDARQVQQPIEPRYEPVLSCLTQQG